MYYTDPYRGMTKKKEEFIYGLYVFHLSHVTTSTEDTYLLNEGEKCKFPAG